MAAPVLWVVAVATAPWVMDMVAMVPWGGDWWPGQHCLRDRVWAPWAGWGRAVGLVS